MKSISFKVLALSATLLFPLAIFAEGNKEKGIDERINDWFAPIAGWWESIVLFPIVFSKNLQMPFIVLLLAVAGLFFTFYFAFVNFRKFSLAIRITRGKYDKLENMAAEPVSDRVNIIEGDIIDTIKDEGHHGEVNHFQALATAVSGTVGLGNIAGVAVAIALGGPGATLWMIVCGLLGMTIKFVECTLAVKYRDLDSKGIVYGGPMYYLSKSFKDTKFWWFGRGLAVLFAILCVGGSFGGGNAFQANQATAQIMSMTGFEGGSAGFIIGLMLAFITGIVIIGG